MSKIMVEIDVDKAKDFIIARLSDSDFFIRKHYNPEMTDEGGCLRGHREVY